MPVSSIQHTVIKLPGSGGKSFVRTIFLFAGLLLLSGFNNLGWGQTQMHFFILGLVTIPEFLFAYVKMNSSYIDLSYITIFHLKTQGV